MSKKRHYTIQWGDTLESIAVKFNANTHEIKHYNHPFNFYVGQVLVIPPIETNYFQNNTMVSLTHAMEYYLKRHLSKKHWFNFYSYVKTHR